MKVLLRLNHFELTDPNLRKRYLRKIHIVGDLARMSNYNGLPARERQVSFEEASHLEYEVSYSEINIHTGFNVRTWMD